MPKPPRRTTFRLLEYANELGYKVVEHHADYLLVRHEGTGGTVKIPMSSARKDISKKSWWTTRKVLMLTSLVKED